MNGSPQTNIADQSIKPDYILRAERHSDMMKANRLGLGIVEKVKENSNSVASKSAELKAKRLQTWKNNNNNNNNKTPTPTDH